MKKIFISCIPQFYNRIPKIKQELEFMGYEVILPNINENLEYTEFCKKVFMDSQEKNKDSDAILVLDFEEEYIAPKVDDYIIKPEINNMDSLMLIYMHDAYLNGNDIFVFNDISNKIFKYEAVAMGAKSLNGNLFNIEENYEKYKNNNLLNYFSIDELSNIENIYDLYSRAFIITSKVFKDKTDKSGKPYFDHLFRVSLNVDEKIEKVAALLHDIVEDTEITFKDLLEIGFPKEVVEIVKLVTKPDIDTSNMTKEEKLELYNNEIDGIIESGNIHAIRLKKADMSDNYNKERLKELPLDKQEWFNEKYGKQLKKLNKVTEKEKVL